MSDTDLTPLTSRTRVALAIARGIAASLGHSDLTPGHIALGLLREGQNPAVAALDHAGADLRLLRRELERTLDPPAQPRPREVALSSTTGEQQLVDKAAVEGHQRNDPYLGTEHFLLAMLRDTSGPTAEVFARYGFDFETAVSHLDAVLHRHRNPPGQPA